MPPPSQPTPWARAMVWVGLLAALGLAASSLPSYLGLELPVHLLAAVLSALVAMFAHSWILIYLAQTGRAVRQLSAAASLSPELGRQARRLALEAWPWALVPFLVLVATALLGESSFDHSLPKGAHHVSGWALAAVQLGAVLAERRLLARNHHLVTELAGQLPS